MMRLLELRDGMARPVLPADRDLASWHQALTSEIATHLTPAHAAILATPVQSGAGLAWVTPGNAFRRFGDLDAADRDKLRASATVILSDIRRLAERGTAPTVRAAWPALRTVPDLNHLFAVDGRPVLAGWGFAPLVGGPGPLAAMDDGVAWRAPPTVAWPVYAGALAALAGLALLVGLLLPLTPGLFAVGANACHVAPAQLALLREQAREAARGNDLKLALAQLNVSRGEQALNCPIPRVQPPPPPDLPEDRWNSHDLGMLQGCWVNTTVLHLKREPTGQVLTVKNWVFCFDGHGHGRQAITLTDGDHCQNNLDASFNHDNTLRMVDVGRCPFRGGPLRHGQMTCHRDSDTDASCDRRDLDGPARGIDQPGGFHRADAEAAAAAGLEPAAQP